MGKIFDIKECTNCGSTDLEWNCIVDNRGMAVDGRLRLHECEVAFFLDCNACSETLKVIRGEEIAEILTDAHKVVL